jgi:prepilin-type N-terminal cleavage/methylation domain-containing protein
MRGLTLVELMTALMIFSLVSTAAISLLLTATNTQRYVMSNTSAVSQAELAFRRIIENVRSSSQAACTLPTQLNLVTQPDTAIQGNPVYNIQYALVGSSLIESDDRYGANTLMSNVSAFNVSVAQNTKPTMFYISMTVSAPNSPPITRHAYVTSRNF